MRTAALAMLSLVLAAAPARGQCPTYCPPEVSLDPHHPDVVGVSPFDATLSYSTPAYVSMDVPRSVSLVYSSHQAAPRAYVQVDVRTLGSTAPQATSIEVVNPATGVVLSAERFYAGADSVLRVVRVAAQWDMSTSPTGSYPIRVIVRNYWNGGAQVQTTSRDTRVLIVNESSSRFGAGWSMPGLLSLHQQGNQDVILTGGDGSAGYFTQSGCTPLDFNSAYLNCDYTSPRGDFSALRLNTQTGLFTRTLTDGTKQVFDGAGKIMYVENRFGHRTTYNWQTLAGHAVPASIVDPAGKTTAFGYNAGGLLSSITTPGTSGGRQTAIAYRNTVRLLRINEPGGSVAVDSVTYDAGGRLLWWKDRAAGRWDVAYDHTQSVDQLQAPLVQSTAGSTRPTTTIRSLRKMTVPAPSTGTTLATRIPAVRVDALWVKVTDASGDSAVATPPGGFGEPARMRDVNGLLGRTYVDSLGRDTLVLTPKGDTIRSTWTGRLLTRVQGGRELNQNNMLMPKWVRDYSYTSYDLVSSATGTGEPARYFYYGSVGQLDSAKVRSQTTRYTYGSNWRLTRVTDPTGLQTNYYPSASGWMNTDSVKTSTRRMAYTYDQYGRPQQTTNPLGHTTSTTYDVLNRVLSSTNERGHTTTFSHTALGLAQVTDAISQTYGFQRNALGWVGVAVDPRGQADTIRYTPVGNVATYKNRRGQTITTTYDARNRPLTVVSGGATLLEYSYDTNGRWTAITTPATSDTIHTDTAGRVVREATVRAGMRFQVQTQRHHDGRPYTLTATAPAASSQMTYLYANNDDRVTGVIFGGVESELLYNNAGQVWRVNVSAPNVQSNVEYGFNTDHALTTVTYSQAAVNDAFGVVYDRDLLGRIRRRKKPVTDSTRTYAYDPAGQLLSHNDSATIRVCDWDPDLRREICWNSRSRIGGASYSYDAVGNRTGSGITLVNGNGLTSFGGYTFQYDADGNLTRKYNTGNPSAFDQTLTWNVLGQLTGVTTSKSGTTTSVAFEYDGLGRRATKTVGGVVTRYIYSGAHIVMEANGSGGVLATYAYNPGVDAPFAMRRGGTTYLYAREATGNVSGLYTIGGQVAARYRYGPWGQIEHEMAGGVQNSLRYTGREWDAETGLYYYRARYYDPQIGRFISEDPIGLAGGINPYVYVGNDPVNLRDPSGLRPYRLAPVGVIVPGNPCNHAVDAGQYYDAWKGRMVFCEGMGLDLEELPHHRQYGNARIAHRELYGPRALTDRERARAECLAAGWLSPGAQQIFYSKTLLVGDLQRLYNSSPFAQAVAIYPDIIVFAGSGRENPRDPLISHGARTIAFITGHEIGHHVQYGELGYPQFRAMWDGSSQGQQFLQDGADEYAEANVASSGPTCAPGS